MKKAFTLLAALAVLALGVPQTASAETLRVGMECTYAPFNFKNADGELDGYDVDVAKGVAGLIGADLKFVCQKWDGMIPALLANKFDLVVASMSITDKRLKKMDFSSTYRISVGRLVGRKNAGWQLFDDAGKPIPANFAGLKVGLERATTYSDWFENELPEAKVSLYDTNAEVFALIDLRADKFKIRAVFLAEKLEVGFHGIGHDDIGPSVHQVEIESLIFIVKSHVSFRKDGFEPAGIGRCPLQADFDAGEIGGNGLARIIEKIKAGPFFADKTAN